jgi:6-phosphogluconolactonase
MSNLKVFTDPEAVAQAVGEKFFKAASTAIEKKGVFTVVLSGGKSPRYLYKFLVRKVNTSPEYGTLLKKTHFFWGDERDVASDNPQSNYGNTQKLFISKINISEDNVHRIKPDVDGAQKAAILYEKLLKSFFELKENQWPCFDLVLLGVGKDGHTASLFPGTTDLTENKKMVISPYVKKLGSYRVTLTVPVFNNASSVFFLVTGEDKAEILREVIEGPYKPDIYPAQLIRPQKGQLFWFVDQGAAKLLKRSLTL